MSPTVLIVPGLRDHVEEHWQTRLAATLPRVCTVAPMGRTDLDCAARVAAIDCALQSIGGPVIVVAHSGGAIMFAHWAAGPGRTSRQIRGALLATPPDFEMSMPEGYPTMNALHDGGWLPVPRTPLPFPSIVAASRNDPLADIRRIRQLARDWGSRFVDLGEVGHLNPASGYGEWPQAATFIRELAEGGSAASRAA